MRLYQIALLSVVFLAIAAAAACAQPAPPGATPAPDGQSTHVAVRILSLDITASPSPTMALSSTPPSTPTFAPFRTPLPTAAVAPGQPTPAASPTPACTNLAEFVQSLNTSDGTAFDPGASFAKIWRIKNIGSCVWTPNYSLIFAGGEAMNGELSSHLTQAVNPGETTDLRVGLVAPTASQAYTGYWMLQEPQGATFGTGSDGSHPLTVVIFVKPTPRPTPG